MLLVTGAKAKALFRFDYLTAQKLTDKHGISGTGRPRTVAKGRGKGSDADRRRHDDTAWPESRFQRKPL